jgi:hypothetical protein
MVEQLDNAVQSDKAKQPNDFLGRLFKFLSFNAPYWNFCITFGLAMSSSIILIYLLNYLHISTISLDFTSIVLIFALSAILSTFVLMFYGGFTDEKLNQDEMRHTFAASLLIGFIILALGTLINVNLKDNTIVAAYIQMVGVIVGFYFGHKSAIQSHEANSTETNSKGVNSSEANSKGAKSSEAKSSEANSKGTTSIVTSSDGTTSTGMMTARSTNEGTYKFGYPNPRKMNPEIPILGFKTTRYQITAYPTTEYPTTECPTAECPTTE